MDALGRAFGRNCRPPSSAAISPPGDDKRNDAALAAIKYAAAALAVVVILALLSRWLGASRRGRYSPKFAGQIRGLIRHAAQSGAASTQDGNPLLALLHANTAMAYADVARRLVPQADLDRMASVDSDELMRTLEDEQIRAMQRIHQRCPDLFPDGVFTVHTGWLG